MNKMTKLAKDFENKLAQQDGQFLPAAEKMDREKSYDDMAKQRAQALEPKDDTATKQDISSLHSRIENLQEQINNLKTQLRVKSQ